MISERALSKCALAEYLSPRNGLIMKMFSLIDVGSEPVLVFLMCLPHGRMQDFPNHGLRKIRRG